MSATFRSVRARTLHEGNHLTLLDCEGWEFVRRRGCSGVVAVIAMTDENEVVLVQQHRPPLGAAVIELPAGLVGDEREETVLEAGARELEEETGFRAKDLHVLWSGPSSAGITDEMITMVLARGLERMHAGGGVEDEQIDVHLVHLSNFEKWLHEQEESGTLVDLKVRLVPQVLEVPE